MNHAHTGGLLKELIGTNQVWRVRYIKVSKRMHALIKPIITFRYLESTVVELGWKLIPRGGSNSWVGRGGEPAHLQTPVPGEAFNSLLSEYVLPLLERATAETAPRTMHESYPVHSTIKRVRAEIYSTVFSRTSNAPAIYPTGAPTYILGSRGSSTIL